MKGYHSYYYMHYHPLYLFFIISHFLISLHLIIAIYSKLLSIPFLLYEDSSQSKFCILKVLNEKEFYLRDKIRKYILIIYNIY